MTQDVPRIVETEAELEELLSRPTDAVVEALGELRGDLVVLGAGGKMGPSLARMARRALDSAGSTAAVTAVSRFARAGIAEQLEADGVRVHSADLLDQGVVRRLPDAAGVVFMAGAKFGTTGDAPRTWATNVLVPALAAQRYSGVPTVVFSSGNVYPFVAADSGGANEHTAPQPLGEYAWSVLGRERMFEHAGVRSVIVRLNYACELRYGVLVDVATRILRNQPIDLATGWVNVIWQGDANAMALASLAQATSPPSVINVTGPECIAVRALAERLGERLGQQPRYSGREQPTALLSDATRALERYGAPRVPLNILEGWVAQWVRRGGPLLDKPTRYEVRDGVF